MDKYTNVQSLNYSRAKAKLKVQLEEALLDGDEEYAEELRGHLQLIEDLEIEEWEDY